MTIEESAKKIVEMFRQLHEEHGFNDDFAALAVEVALHFQRDDMRERAANRADGSLLIGSEIAKEIRDLK